jgi:hypothetical protein
VASLQKRTPLFEAFLENGVNWTRRPISAFCWRPDAPVRPLQDHVYWDCFSPYIDVQVRARLAGLRADLITWQGHKRQGHYMMTLDWSWECFAWMKATITFIPTTELFGMTMPG